MASILDTLAQGLRGVGAVYSPRVYATQAAERENEANRGQRNKEMVLGLLANAVEKGVMSPEDFQQRTQEMGYGNLPLGPSAQTRELTRLQEMRASRSPAQQRIFSRGKPPQIDMPPTQQPFTQDSIRAALAMGGGPTREADAVLQESGRREDMTVPATNVTGQKYDPRLDPSAWMEYAQDREMAGDMEEVTRAYAMAEKLENQMKPELKEVGGNLYQVQPQVDSGSVTGFSATPVEGIAPREVTAPTLKEGRNNGKDEYFYMKDGQPVWTGIAAPEKAALVNNYAGPMAGVDKDGNPVFFQPSRSGGKPSIVEGVSPPEAASVKKAKLAEEKGRAAVNASLKQVDDIRDYVRQNPGAVGVRGMAGRFTEGVSGQLGAPLPPTASKFQSKIKLFQSTLWRDLVGSGQLSKGDYDHLNAILKGLGPLDSPSTTIAAFDEIESYIRSKANIAPEYTQEELEFTAKKHGISVEEVKKRLAK